MHVKERTWDPEVEMKIQFPFVLMDTSSASLVPHERDLLNSDMTPTWD